MALFAAQHRQRLLEAVGAVGVGATHGDAERLDAERRLDHHARQAHSAERRVEQLGVAVGREREQLAGRRAQRQRGDVPGEASVAVVVLAVDVARDRAAERDVARTGDDRERQPVGRQRGEQLRDRRAGLRRDGAGARRRSRRSGRAPSGRAPCRRRSGLRRRSCVRPRARSRRRGRGALRAWRTSFAPCGVTTRQRLRAVRPQPLSERAAAARRRLCAQLKDRHRRC